MHLSNSNPALKVLVHISEMSWSKRTKNPKKIVRPGEEVEVQVLGIDTEERRISLGMKQLQENPWETIGERYQVGSKIKGKVRNLTDFGAFVEVEEGVDGLVHVSDISHSKKIKHPKDVLKKDQEVEAVVTNIDTEGHRLSLSIKELTPSTWDAFVETHNPAMSSKEKFRDLPDLVFSLNWATNLKVYAIFRNFRTKELKNRKMLFRSVRN